MAIPTPLISQKTGDPLSRLLNQFRILQVFVVKFPWDIMARIDSALGTIGLQPIRPPGTERVTSRQSHRLNFVTELFECGCFVKNGNFWMIDSYSDWIPSIPIFFLLCP